MEERKKRAKKKAVATPAVKAEHQAEEAVSPQTPKLGRGNWLRLGLAGIPIAIGVFLGWIWVTHPELSWLGVIAIALCAGGGYLLRRFLKGQEGSGTVIIDKAPVPKVQVNSLNIYPERVVFENVYEPEGQPWQCMNDGKRYFVHIWDEVNNRLKAFALPDQQYYDPVVFAQRVLGLPAHRRIFRRKQSLFQKLSPVFLLVAIVAVWILIITTT